MAKKSVPLICWFQTSEMEMIAKERGSEKAEGASEHQIFKIDIPANRSVFWLLQACGQPSR